MRRRACYRTVAVVLVALAVGPSWVGAGDGRKEDGLRVKDLPKPIPQAMDKIKEVGDEAGKGISKAVNAGVDAVNKVMKGNKDRGK